jgi:hypothetical protein
MLVVADPPPGVTLVAGDPFPRSVNLIPDPPGASAGGASGPFDFVPFDEFVFDTGDEVEGNWFVTDDPGVASVATAADPGEAPEVALAGELVMRQVLTAAGPGELEALLEVPHPSTLVHTSIDPGEGDVSTQPDPPGTYCNAGDYEADDFEPVDFVTDDDCTWRVTFDPPVAEVEVQPDPVLA